MEREQDAIKCPVCGKTYSPGHCPRCDWEMESEYILGAITPEEHKNYQEKLNTARQRWCFDSTTYYKEGGRLRPHEQLPLEKEREFLLFQHEANSNGELERSIEEWRNSKRAFIAEEIPRGRWIKIPNFRTWQFMMQCYPDGTLIERELFDPEEWQGSWRLAGPVLRINTETDNKYELDVFASKDNDIHTGIEFIEGIPEYWTYFKVIHIL